MILQVLVLVLVVDADCIVRDLEKRSRRNVMVLKEGELSGGTIRQKKLIHNNLFSQHIHLLDLHLRKLTL